MLATATRSVETAVEPEAIWAVVVMTVPDPAGTAAADLDRELAALVGLAEQDAPTQAPAGG